MTVPISYLFRARDLLAPPIIVGWESDGGCGQMLQHMQCFAHGVRGPTTQRAAP